MADSTASGWYDSFTVAVEADACPTYGGVEGVVGYTEEIDTYTYLTLTDPTEYWRVATFVDMYNTVENGGLFPWDDNRPTDDVFKGMKQAGEYLSLTAAALIISGLTLA